MIEPKPYRFKHSGKRLCTVDLETDPFKHGREVRPFFCGFYDGATYRDFWGDDCVSQFFVWLAGHAQRLGEELLIYAHNGGKFDFLLMLDHFDKNQFPQVINGRIVSCRMGGHEFRDSFAIIPEGLDKYQKTKIDYDKFERGARDIHKPEIAAYLKDDCVFLYQLVSGFHDMFGDRLTIGSTALPQLRSFHGFETFNAGLDRAFRPFYFGGRVQCFETGIRRGKFRVFDVRSMYPDVMLRAKHPISNKFDTRRQLQEGYHFAKIDAINDGALCSRADNGALTFQQKRGTFFATNHEINAGLETGTLKITKVHYSQKFTAETSFGDFVTHFYALRQDAKDRGDKLNSLFYKLVLNSAYGKFAQDPSKYKDYALTDGPPPNDEPVRTPENPGAWLPEYRYQNGVVLWEKPALASASALKNVATAASITGAARAKLLRGIASAQRPLYCDTDSIICEVLGQFDASDTDSLGQWNCEAEGDLLAIAGKKMYALYDGDKLVKSASKGVRLGGKQIMALARGELVEFPNPVPNIKKNGAQIFVTRNVTATGDSDIARIGRAAREEKRTREKGKR